jgi:hypothetical protein
MSGKLHALDADGKPTGDWSGQLDLFFGEANPAVARVYMRFRPPFPNGLSAKDLVLSGRLVGPFCEFAETLPLRLSFTQLQNERNTNALLAEATVPDPNFWTPELPFQYRAEIELLHRKEVLFSHKLRTGIRRFGARGEFLSFEGKRFVLRGVHVDGIGSGDFSLENEAGFARESWTAIVFPEPFEANCQFTSRKGWLVVADLASKTRNEAELQTELHRLGKWPSVCIAALSSTAPISKTVRLVAPNLSLAQFVAVDQTFEWKDWADLAIVEVGDSQQFAEKAAGCPIPVIAIRRPQGKTSGTFEQLRAACDELQYDLARFDDYAGYIV